jgi:hypothetical protein
MRIFDIIKSELNTDKLKLEEEFERVINNKSLETDDKVATIKKILKEIAIIEVSFKKFGGYITEEKNDELTKE